MSPPAAALLDQTARIGYRKPGLEKMFERQGWIPFTVNHAQVYVAAIRKCSHSFRAIANDEPLMFLLPVLEIYITILCGDLAQEDRWLRQGKRSRQQLPHPLESTWDRLRMSRHNGSGPRDCF